MNKIYETLLHAISELESMSDIETCTPDGGPSEEENLRKAIYLTAACAIMYEIYPSLEKTPELKKLFVENQLLDRINRRILHITMSDLAYPTDEEVIEAGKAILEAR